MHTETERERERESERKERRKRFVQRRLLVSVGVVLWILNAIESAITFIHSHMHTLIHLHAPIILFLTHFFNDIVCLSSYIHTYIHVHIFHARNTALINEPNTK